VLIRELREDGEPSYQASDEFKAYVALAIYRGEAARQAREN
jgi:hypothetical protein